MEIDPSQSIAKFWEKESTLLQPTEDFEQRDMALQPTNRQKSIVLFLPERPVEEDGVRTKPLDL